MSRLLIAFIGVLTAASLQAQHDTRYKFIGGLPDKSVEVFDAYYSGVDDDFPNHAKGWGKVIMVINKNGDIDTVTLIDQDYAGLALNACEAKWIDLDKTKNRAVALTLKTVESSNIGEAGGYHLYQTRTQIWDLSNPKKVFSPVTDYNYSAQLLFHNDTTSTEVNIECLFQQRVSVSSRGKVKVGKLHKQFGQDCSSYTEEATPDPDIPPQPGGYTYIRGSYVPDE